jgi:hypothetical protein
MYKLLKGLETPGSPTGGKGGFGKVATAVFWSFFGIRRMGALKTDAASLTPLQLIAGGVIGAGLFAGALIVLVRFLTR